MNTYDDAEYWRLRFAEEHSRKMEERRFNRLLCRLLVGAFAVIAISMVCVTQAAAAPTAATITEEEFWLLCRCVEAEAGNQPEEGRRAVAEVVLNRVDDTGYPDNIVEVINDAGEFAVVTSGSIDRVTVTQTTLDAVNAALEERAYPSDMLWFRTQRYHGWGTAYKQIGSHYFSTR